MKLPLLLSFGLTLLCLLSFAVSHALRGWRRLNLQRWAIYLGVPAVTATLVLVPSAFDLSFSDSLAVAGLGLSLLFGMGARMLERLTMRVRVGIVIPSRVPFHAELRAGLKDAMSPVRLEVYDDYLATTGAQERLSEFVPALRRTLDWEPDYLVVCSPSVDLVSSDRVIDALTSFSRRGGGIVFIDNQPVEELRSRLRRYGHVHSDVKTGARVIAQYVTANLHPGDSVLVLAGPPSSEPAQLRRDVLEAELPTADVRVADSGGWTEHSTRAATARALEQGLRPRFIICGNDVMAFGAVLAVREARRILNEEVVPEIIGYDGIARALWAIAEPDNPFAATVSTPPGAYGHEIAAMVLSDARRWAGRSHLHSCCIPVGEGQLVTRYNVDMVLEA